MKKLFFTVILLTIMLLSLEGLSYVTYGLLHEKIFSHKDLYLVRVNEESFQDWIRRGQMFDRTLGWDLPGRPTVKVGKNCRGEEVTYSWNGHARTTKDLVEGQEIMGLFGDSYAHGDEVSDEFTISSVLTSKYNIPTKNFGVGGFGPTQALLKFQRTVEGSHFDIVVLQIMHENIQRMANSFRPVLLLNTEGSFSFKPFTSNSEIHTLAYPKTWVDFQESVDEAFEKDFWSKPQGQFPYSVSLGKALFTNHFMIKGIVRTISPPYYYEYHFSQLKSDLEFLINEFRTLARNHGKIPIVVFVPQSQETYQVAHDFAVSINEKFGEEFVFDATMDGINWDEYNLKIGCHPSQTGYSHIAKFIADLIHDKGLLDLKKIRLAHSRTGQDLPKPSLIP